MNEVMELLGFVPVGRVENQRMVYFGDLGDVAGRGGAVYVFVNPDGYVWKVGMTRKGESRVNYTGVLDGTDMKRPHEQAKLMRIRKELQDGAVQWVRRTCDPELLEDLLSCILEPTETKRRRSKRETAVRRLLESE